MLGKKHGDNSPRTISSGGTFDFSIFALQGNTHPSEILIEWLSHVHATAPTFTADWSCVISCGSSLQTSTFVLWWDNGSGKKSCCLIKARFQHSAGEYKLVGRSSIWKICKIWIRRSFSSSLHSCLWLVQVVRMARKPDCLKQGPVPFQVLPKILSTILASGNGKGNVLLSARDSPPQRDPRTLWRL